MPLVYPNMQMSEVVEEHPSLIPVINRFGIRLGLGDKSVKAICEEYRLDTDFLLTVINTFLNEEYFPEKKLQTFHTSQIIDYLTKTNQYYQRYQIPNIERHRFIHIDEYAGKQHAQPDREVFLILQRRADLTDRKGRPGLVPLLPVIKRKTERLSIFRAGRSIAPRNGTAIGRSDRGLVGGSEKHHGQASFRRL